MADSKNKTPFYLIDTSSAFYRPLALRIGICVTAFLWLGLEVWGRDPFWMVISGAMAVYCLYVLLIAYKLPEETPPAEKAEEDDAEPAEPTLAEDPTVIADQADDDTRARDPGTRTDGKV